MRLIYTDEAGTAANEAVCVVAALIVDADHQLRNMEREISDTIKNLVPEIYQEGFVIHALEIYNDRDKKYSEWDFGSRLDFLKSLSCIPRYLDIPISMAFEFKVNWEEKIGSDKLKFSKMTSNQYSHFMAFIRCMERSDHFIRKYLNSNEIGSVVAEDVPHMKHILHEFGLAFRENPIISDGDGLRKERHEKALGIKPESVEHKITCIIDKPNFVEKSTSKIIQISDICAFSFRRALNGFKHGDELVLTMLGPDEGNHFLNYEVWKEGPASSAVFNCRSFMNDDQKLMDEVRMIFAGRNFPSGK